MYLSAILLITVLFAGLCLYIAFKALRRFGWFFAWLRGSIGLFFLSLAGFASWAAYDLANYDELFEDRPIASISFEAIEGEEQKYTASIAYYIDRDGADFEVHGDQWQVDARIIRWTGPLAALGAKPGFRLDRLSGRYYSLQDERSKPRTVYTLNEQGSYSIDMWSLLYREGFFLPGLDATYGSAAYLPMADSASYELSLSYSGLTAKPTNKIAKDAVAKWK